ncbi:MAG: Histone-lysine N-methyltransferase set9 [Thelocarpon impressellum]|nr:MAG: Histone-lysine N-methyltransferase set9 [Thelocarpon impressellum]
MPPRAKPTTPGKKEPLTLAQLASYDDVCTDALVDRVYFWTTIRKNRSKYFASRGMRDEDVASIIRDSVVVSKDTAAAETRLLQLTGLRKFVDRLRTAKEKEDFRRHLRKYVGIYLPECPFEVSTTNRYTVVSHEAAVTARRAIKKGETVRHLSGIQVSLSREEELDLDLRRRDFSIVMSSRKKSASIFLGPARFANHDCDANARLVTTGVNGMEVVAVREIEVGDEITVTYGDDYFGADNCECLCRSCEMLARNGWAPKDSDAVATRPETLLVSTEPQADGPYSFRRKRKYVLDRESSTPSATPELKLTPALKKRRVGRAALDEASPEDSRTPAVKAHETAFERSTDPDYEAQEAGAERLKSPDVEATEIELKTPSSADAAAELEDIGVARDEPGAEPPIARSRDAQDGEESRQGQTSDEPLPLLTPKEEDMESDRPTSAAAVTLVEEIKTEQPSIDSTSPYSSTFEELQKSTPSTKASSVFDEAILEKPATLQITAAAGPASGDSESELSELSDAELDEENMTIITRPRRRRRRKNQPVPVPDLDPNLHVPSTRVPGDYVLTPTLLVESYSAWIICTICASAFVQPDAYFTRAACPRCERHSKLYGYAWPKTERVGKGDKEERVLDHRTVHRFIRPEEERDVKKSKVRDLSGRRSLGVDEGDDGKRKKGRRGRFSL